MGQLILCKTKRAENPFFVESGKVNIYSLEELMYYVQSASFVTRDDFQNNEFIEWVRQELQLSELADILQKKLDEEVGLKDFFIPLEAANGYLTTSEIQILNLQLQKFDHLTGLEAKKLYADHFLSLGQMILAIQAYRQILDNMDFVKKEQEHVLGDIWNNLGVAYALLWDFHEAGRCLIQAYRFNHRAESLKMAVDAACLSGNENGLQELKRLFQANEQSIEREQKQVQDLLQQTTDQHSLSERKKLLQQWQKNYLKMIEG